MVTEVVSAFVCVFYAVCVDDFSIESKEAVSLFVCFMCCNKSCI